MKKLFLRAEFGPLREPWEEDEIGRKNIFTYPDFRLSWISGKVTITSIGIDLCMMSFDLSFTIF
jgi:hypothetical protein